jgi:glycosyltransferase involved in cell wall biosynthesis
MKKLLVITSAYPRWKDDVYANFVNELLNHLNTFDITVLAPHDHRIKKQEIINNIKIKRFTYFYPSTFQKLAYAVIPNLKKNPFLIFQVPFFIFSFLLLTIKIIKKEKFDVINSQWLLPSGLIGAFCKKLFHIKHVATTHGGDIETLNKIPFKRKIANFIFKNSNYILFVSFYTKNIFKNLIKKEFRNDFEKRSLILPMGIDILKLRNKTKLSEIKKIYDINSDKNLIFLGRLEKRKGINYLINATPKILRKFNVNLFILGDGPIKKDLINQVKGLNLQNNVKFLGHTTGKKKLDFLKLADILIIPSLSEGLPVTLLEGFATKKVIIATRIAGIPDVIKHNFNGILINPKSENEISNSVINLFNNPKLMKKLSKNAYKTSKDYNWKKISKEYTLIFNE